MEKVNNQTEKEYRDNQTKFGHLDKGVDVTEWLKNEYYPDTIRERRYRAVAKKFLGNKKNLKVLEIAAGVGDFVVYASKLFPEHAYFANELSRKQLEGNIQSVANHFGVTQLPQLSFGPVENLQYEDGFFDVVFIKAAVHHFENPSKGLNEIHRVLARGGVLVFFEEPVCLDIPIYKQWVQKNFSLSERALGINEHIYTKGEYFSFGKLFSKKTIYLDEELVREFDTQQSKRTGIRFLLGFLVRKVNFLFYLFMIWRFSPIVFVFEK
jgi:ubiquinone/menaquinone biosynthesis C-methylase UbiE